MSSVQQIFDGLLVKREDLAAELKRQDEEHFAKLLHGEEMRAEQKAQIASRLHLLDLKRAGHSPRFTEYSISTERPYAPRNYVTFGSIYGSPALSCANS